MGDKWYCLIFGEELGPMSWDDLLSMAAHGTLGRRERVKQGPHAEWIAAESVPGLFSTASAAQASSAETRTQTSTVDDTDFEVNATPLPARAPLMTDDDADFELAPAISPIREEETDFEIAVQSQTQVTAAKEPSNELDFDVASDVAAPVPSEYSARKHEDDADEGFAPAESASASPDDADFELAPKLAEAQHHTALSAEIIAPEGPSPAELSDAAELTEAASAEAQADPTPPVASEAAPTVPADDGRSQLEIGGQSHEAPKAKKPKRKAGAGLSAESQRALRLVAGTAGVIGLAFLGYLGVNALAAMRSPNYDEILAGYGALFQQARLAKSDPSVSADPKAAMQFLATLNKLRQPLRASSPDSADADLADAGTLLAQMYASAAARPGSPEAREGIAAEHEFLTKITAVRRKLDK